VSSLHWQGGFVTHVLRFGGLSGSWQRRGTVLVFPNRAQREPKGCRYWYGSREPGFGGDRAAAGGDEGKNRLTPCATTDEDARVGAGPDERVIKQTTKEGSTTTVRCVDENVEERGGKVVRYVFVRDQRVARLDGLSADGAAPAGPRKRPVGCGAAGIGGRPADCQRLAAFVHGCQPWSTAADMTVGPYTRVDLVSVTFQCHRNTR
jgi:hypothetical protein